MGNRNLCALLFFSLFCGTLFAAADKKIVVETANGTADFSLSEIRCVKFNDDIMSINMHDGSALSWNTDDVVCMRVDGEQGGNVTSIGNMPADAMFEKQGSCIVVRSASRQALLLYSADGVLLYSSSFCGEEAIELSKYPRGVYILNVNGHIYKIINR